MPAGRVIVAGAPEPMVRSAENVVQLERASASAWDTMVVASEQTAATVEVAEEAAVA